MESLKTEAGMAYPPPAPFNHDPTVGLTCRPNDHVEAIGSATRTPMLVIHG